MTDDAEIVAGDDPDPDAELPEGQEPLEVLQEEAPVTPEALEALGEMQRKSAISRTDTQAISGFMIVGLFAFLAAYFKLDLDPVKDGYQSDFPKHIGEALTAIGTIIAVRVMNRR